MMKRSKSFIYTSRSHRTVALNFMAMAALCFPSGMGGRLRADDNSSRRAKPNSRPNIVFILADDWGWSDLGCYGHRRIKTPHLDSLAKQGTLFTQFYVCSAVCSPSRTAFMTGQFPARHRIHGHLATDRRNRQRNMPNFLDPHVPMVSRFLKQSGYATGHYGKWHLGHNKDAPTPDAYGFDEYRAADSRSPNWNLWDPELRPRSSEYIIDETIAFIDRHKDRPFFVQAWLLDTHATLNPTDEQMKPYARFGPKGVRFKSAAQVYYSAATDSDRHIGRLLKRLDTLGLADNTIVIFSSDNGPEDFAIGNASHSAVGSTGPFRGRKRSIYEGGVRVPFIVRWPNRTPAGRIDETTVLAAVDFLPTICRLANASLPADLKLDGDDLSAALTGKPTNRRKPLMWEWRYQVYGHAMHQSPMLAIRDGKWKLLLNPDRSRVELYDIPADPMELKNLSQAQPKVVARLSEQLLAWQKELPQGAVHPKAGQVNFPWPGKVK